MLTSAFICPGTGQLIQRRWLAGSFFMVGFLWGFFWVMFVAFRTIAAYYSFASDIDAQIPENTGATAFIAPVSLALSFYILNLFEMIVHNNRAAGKKREEAFLKSTISAIEAKEKTSTPPST